MSIRHKGEDVKVTVKQARVLDNLDRIVILKVGERTISTLDGEECRFQLVSLGARGAVARDDKGEWIKIRDPDGIVGAPHWPAPDSTQGKVR